MSHCRQRVKPLCHNVGPNIQFIRSVNFVFCINRYSSLHTLGYQTHTLPPSPFFHSSFKSNEIYLSIFDKGSQLFGKYFIKVKEHFQLVKENSCEKEAVAAKCHEHVGATVTLLRLQSCANCSHCTDHTQTSHLFRASEHHTRPPQASCAARCLPF